MNINIPTAASRSLNLMQSTLSYGNENQYLGKGMEWLFSNVETAEIMKMRSDWKAGEIANAIKEICINSA